ncbi:MAG: tryptophan synthase subunit alpha, partial [Oscillospiraceae bacterium]|nr:tryptophan synthase subunit alpha [Oscillospiraceae bacterium]
MNRIDERLGELKKQGKKALITFLTVGDPNFDVSEKAVIAMQEEGVDLIELGVPFSDPSADGPTIQAADIRALEQGADIFKIFEFVERVREKITLPMVFLLYYNVMLQYGLDEFFKRCQSVGIDGLIIPDLPYEESGEIKEYTEKYGV